MEANKQRLVRAAIVARYGTQRKFARVLGKSDSHVSCIVRGRRRLGEQERYAWECLLGKEVASCVR